MNAAAPAQRGDPSAELRFADGVPDLDGRSCRLVRARSRRHLDTIRGSRPCATSYSMTRNQEAIRRLFRVGRDVTGNLPALPAIYPGQPRARRAHGPRRRARIDPDALGLPAAAEPRQRAGDEHPQHQEPLLARLAQTRISDASSRRRAFASGRTAGPKCRIGSRSARNGHCSPSRASGAPGLACGARKPRRSRASICCSPFSRRSRTRSCGRFTQRRCRSS